MKQILTVLFLFFAFSVSAAGLKLTSQIQEIGIGQQFQINLVLDTEDEEINAVEGKIVFQADLLELKEIRDGNSIINFWIDPVRNCVSNGVERPDSICFSGIIPGGYLGEGFIFSAIFQAKKEGAGIIEIQDAKALQNDGKGTPANTKIFNFQFSISKNISGPEFNAPKDTDPPEEFKPEIARDETLFDGKWFLVFATQDKGTGIDYYEVCEGSKKKCVSAESPYVLKDQKLKSYIYVKAVDKAGNERMAILPPQNPLKWYENYFILGIIILIVLGYASRILWPRFTKSR